MITQPNHSKTLNKSKLSAAGQSRRDEMLSELQDAMALDHSRRQNRKRVFKFSALLLVLISSCSWMVWQSMKPKEFNPDTTAEMNKSKVESVLDKDRHKNAKPNSSGSLNHSKPAVHTLPKKKSLVEKYVVSTASIETRQMESINDDEMLKLLKQAGVQGFIAEIGDEKVVVDDDGKKL